MAYHPPSTPEAIIKLSSSRKKMKISATHINGSTVHDESTLSHGGHGDSGWGRFGGDWGLLEFVHTRTVMMNK
jgi:acyl-CoA reductase-like NAD-dependent aldehyde dehydrogenase